MSARFLIEESSTWIDSFYSAWFLLGKYTCNIVFSSDGNQVEISARFLSDKNTIIQVNFSSRPLYYNSGVLFW